MELLIYIAIDIILSFPLYWLAYRDVKRDNLKLSPYKKRSHEDIKTEAIRRYVPGIVLGSLFWPLTYFVGAPVCVTIYATTKFFSWAIDKLEGGKDKETK